MDKNTNLLNKLCQMNAIQLLYADMDEVENVFKNAPYTQWMQEAFDKFVRDFKRFGQFLDEEDLYTLRNGYRQYYLQLRKRLESDVRELAEFDKAYPMYLADLEHSFVEEDGNTVR